MSEFVLNDLGHALLGRRSAGLLIEHQVNDTVGDESPVLHGTGREVGDGDHVHLGEGEVDAEDLLVECEGLGGKVKGEATVLDVLAGRRVDANGHPEVVGLDDIELTHDKGEKVRRHLGRFVEGNGLLGSSADLRLVVSLRGNVHVAQRSQVLVRDERHGELGFQGRLVEAGESPASISRLHLADGENAIGAIGLLVCGAVEASHLVIELTSELDLQLRLAAFADGIVEVELGHLSGFVVGDYGGRAGGRGCQRRESSSGRTAQDRPERLVCHTSGEGSKLAAART